AAREQRPVAPRQAPLIRGRSGALGHIESLPTFRFFAILGTGAASRRFGGCSVRTDAMSDTNGRDADAIRYAVLRKLASAIRHSLMGDLQRIQFSAELAAKMIDKGSG